MTDVDPDAVAAAALACDDVVAVTGGLFGAGTYLPGRRVPGIRIAEHEVEVHIVARFGPSMDEVARAVRTAVAPVAGGRPVTVVVEDLDTGPTAHAIGPRSPDISRLPTS